MRSHHLILSMPRQHITRVSCCEQHFPRHDQSEDHLSAGQKLVQVFHCDLLDGSCCGARANSLHRAC